MCKTTGYNTAIIDIDDSDVTVQVEYSNNPFGKRDLTGVREAMQNEAQQGCARFGKRAEYLSNRAEQVGNQYNGWRTIERNLYACVDR